MKRSILVFALCVVTFVNVGCKAAPKNNSTAPQTLAPSDMKAPQAGASLSGKVVETMNSGGYTYVCIEKSGQKTWAAIPMTEVKVGQDIALRPGAEMRNFTSKTLNRTFDSIIFSSGRI